MQRRPHRARSVALAVLLATSLVACGSSSDDDAIPDADTSASADESTTSTAATDADESTATTGAEPQGTTSSTAPEDNPEGVDTETSVLDTLPDGDHYGYLAGLETGTVEGQSVQVIIFDPVDYLTGDEANQAALADGAIGPDDGGVPNGYYIRNDVQTVIRLAVVPEAQVRTLAGGGPDLVPSSVDEVWRQQHLFKVNAQNVRGTTTLSGIEAVYLP